jgi:hypothetical protein
VFVRPFLPLLMLGRVVGYRTRTRREKHCSCQLFWRGEGRRRRRLPPSDSPALVVLFSQSTTTVSRPSSSLHRRESKQTDRRKWREMLDKNIIGLGENMEGFWEEATDSPATAGCQWINKINNMKEGGRRASKQSSVLDGNGVKEARSKKAAIHSAHCPHIPAAFYQYQRPNLCAIRVRAEASHLASRRTHGISIGGG